MHERAGTVRLAAALALLSGGCSLFDAARSKSGDAAPVGDGGNGDAAADDGCGFSDDFEDGVTGAEWHPFEETGANLREFDGRLEVVFTGAAEAWAGYELMQEVDLSEGEVRVEVSSAGGVYTGLQVWLDDMQMEIYAEDVTCLVGQVCGTPGNDDCNEILYNPQAHVIWRIRTADGVVYWEASQAGMGWELVHTQPVPFPLDRTTVILDVGGASGDPPATFESFAVRPTGCAQ